jgi:hypothetical protein
LSAFYQKNPHNVTTLLDKPRPIGRFIGDVNSADDNDFCFGWVAHTLVPINLSYDYCAYRSFRVIVDSTSIKNFEDIGKNALVERGVPTHGDRGVLCNNK